MLTVPSRQRGVSLVELMISMVLGLMLILAIFAGYVPIKSTVEQSKALEQANEVLRFATLTFTNSIKQADQLIAVTPDRLMLAFKVEGAVQVLSCLGNQKTADFTEQYRFTPPVLSCDDGDGPRLLLAHLQDLEFGQQGTLVNIRILPKGCPAIWSRGRGAGGPSQGGLGGRAGHIRCQRHNWGSRMNKGLKRQRGAVLLVVLVVSLLSSLLVFTSIQENQLQTRLSGNFHKKINAQLSAEQGMNESYRALHQALGAEPRIEWDRLVQKVPGKGEGAMAGSRFSIEQLDTEADSKLALQSHGRYLEGNASLNALFALKREPGNLIFQDSVVACEGLSLSGSGLIDSYDSRKGKYGGTNINQNAKVATVSDKANVVLDGNSPIWGDVRATGSVTLNGSSLSPAT